MHVSMGVFFWDVPFLYGWGGRRSAHERAFFDQIEGWEAPSSVFCGDREEIPLAVGDVLGSYEGACSLDDALVKVGRHFARV